METLVTYFGPLTAVAIVLALWWKYVKPKLEAQDKQREQDVADLRAEVRRLTDLGFRRQT